MTKFATVPANVDFADMTFVTTVSPVPEPPPSAWSASAGAPFFDFWAPPKKPGPRSRTQAGFLSASRLIRWRRAILPRLPPASIQPVIRIGVPGLDLSQYRQRRP